MSTCISTVASHTGWALFALGLGAIALAIGIARNRREMHLALEEISSPRRAQRGEVQIPVASRVRLETHRLKYRRHDMGYSYADLKGDKPYSPPTNGTDTSDAAAASIRKIVGKQLEEVLGLIRTAGMSGRTTDEVEEITGGKHQAISARFHDLHTTGRIYCNVDDSKDRRPTRSGRMARIYRAIEFKPQAQAAE